MITWENGGIAPVYLCENHAAHITQLSEDGEPQSGQSKNSRPAEVLGAAMVDATASDIEGVTDVVPEDFGANGKVLQDLKPLTATKQAERVNVERFCISRYGERCSSEAAVHCPKCGRWFCDAHAEDENWHVCVPTI